MVRRVGDDLPPMEPDEPELSEPTPSSKPKGKRPKGKRNKEIEGRFQLLNGFVDFAMGKLSRGEIACWLILYRDARKGIAKTSMSDLAKRGGINKATAFRAVKSLREKGLVEIVSQGGLAGKRLSCYRLLPSNPIQ